MAGRVEVVPLEADHCIWVSERMRAPDLREYKAMSGEVPPAEGLQDLRRKSRRAKAGLFDGEPIAIWGLVSRTLVSDVAHPWLLATDGIDRREVRREFIARSRFEAANLMAGYQLYLNFCDIENTRAIRWLKWMGFEFEEIRTHTFNGVDFVKFWKETDVR